MNWIQQNKLYLLIIGGVIAGVTLIAVFVLPSWFWHPLATQVCRAQYHTQAQVRDCLSYNYHSGIGSDLGELTLIGTLVVGFATAHRLLHKHFECHADTCKKLGFHHVEGTHFRTCWHHHPVLSSHDHHKVPLQVIHDAAADAAQKGDTNA